MNSGSSAFIVSGGQSAARLGHQVVIPEVAAFGHVARGVVAFDDDDFFDAGGLLQRFVGNAFQRDVLAGAQRDVGGDQQLAGGIVDAAGQRVGAEAAEHDRMDRPDAARRRA